MSTVLVVEDLDVLRHILVAELMDAGYEVLEANGSSEALAHLDRRPDAILTDIRMPGNVDGWALAERARLVDAHVGVVYTSGYTDAERPVVNSRFVGKPYHMTDVLEALAHVLSQR